MKFAVLGEALIDFMMGRDGSYRPHLGGSPYNVAISLARQGMPVSYLSKLSDDCFGEQLANSLIDEGVELASYPRSVLPTSLAMVTIDSVGQPSYRLYREGIADKDTSLDEILASLPDDLSVFHTGSLAITPSQLPKIRRLFDLLKQRGVLISVDINIRLGASLDKAAYLDGVRSLLPLVDIVKASDEDLQAFALQGSPADVATLFYAEMSGGLFILTEGNGGALLLSHAGSIRRKAYPVARVIDTVGAGDTFHSAFLAKLVRDGDIDLNAGSPADCLKRCEDALDFACAAAAINVSRAGCSPPTVDEVNHFILSAAR
ncbi:PfkB family carbohydrate kinase [Arenicella xantha]|uniref:Fructokinase n=1 Tax=Arenicella xantha TaxID=644221 RepID=A0A395JPE8_9GAMM|nr:PfkB family carbohydrate kinase [Arenicella xantha]RBP53479.1 fructokinase [Arenicella xantha]